MKQTQLHEELLKMRFPETYEKWKVGEITQREAALILGYSDRQFRRDCRDYEAEGLDGLLDHRLHQVSHRKAPVDEVLSVVSNYQTEYEGWNVRHFRDHYKKQGGSRSYSWVKSQLQASGSVKKGQSKGTHRKKRDRKPMIGMMIHQDASTHEWVEGFKWDLVVTMDDATSEHYSMFFVEQEGTMSSLQGVYETIANYGIFSSFYSDRGSHYWSTPKAGGKVDKTNLTQFGQAMKALSIEMIAAYSPQARGRSERMFRTHQDRLVKELAKAKIRDMQAANDFLREVYMPQFNQQFRVKAQISGSAFVSCQGIDLSGVLCVREERVVGNDNCISFENKKLQIPADKYRHHYVKAKVTVKRHIDHTLSIWYGPRQLAKYTCEGVLLRTSLPTAA